MSGDYSVADVRRILDLTAESFRNCLRAALYPARAQRFAFHDLILLKAAKGLCEAGIPIPRIRRVLKSLKQRLPPDQQLSTVRIYADGRRVVVWDESGRWQPDSGQFLIDFDVKNVAPGAIPWTRRQKAATSPSAEQWFERGLQLEADSRAEAMHAYEEATQRDPSLVEAHINLGLLCHQTGDLKKAEHCYRAAIAAAPGEVLGYFNLAVVLTDQGQRAEAIEAYRTVLDRQPHFRDAHYNLATLYELEGRHAEAIRHYAAAKKLTTGER